MTAPPTPDWAQQIDDFQKQLCQMQQQLRHLRRSHGQYTGEPRGAEPRSGPLPARDPRWGDSSLADPPAADENPGAVEGQGFPDPATASVTPASPPSRGMGQGNRNVSKHLTSNSAPDRPSPGRGVANSGGQSVKANTPRPSPKDGLMEGRTRVNLLGMDLRSRIPKLLFPEGGWESMRKRGTVWLLSISLHLSLLILLACWSIHQGTRIPLDLVLGATSSAPLEMAAIEVAAFDEPSIDDREEFPSQLLVPDPTDLTPPNETIATLPVNLLNPLPLAGDTPTSPRTAEGSGKLAPTAGGGKGESSGGKRPKRGTADSESVEFFGAQGIARRVVFLVDNSNSMHSGRFETALAELQQSVMQLQPTQAFYVIFYSDAAYGLFHPHTAADLVPATDQNKMQLSDWLATVEMCTGGQLLEAFEWAERLQPDAVFLLSDGVIRSEAAMSHILNAAERPFTLHTIGLTVPDPASGMRLQAMADAHHGTLQLVGIHPAARMSAQMRPIRRNRARGPVWGIRLP